MPSYRSKKSRNPWVLSFRHLKSSPGPPPTTTAKSQEVECVKLVGYFQDLATYVPARDQAQILLISTERISCF